MMAASRSIALQERALAESDDVGRDARFASLVERQSRFVFRIAYGLLRNTHDAEDAVQETFLKLYRSGAWQGMNDERAFLARTAWRIAVDRLPKVRFSTNEVEMPTVAANPEQAAISADWSAVVHRLIDGLPEELRQALVLSGEELNSREIAEVLGISDATVRSRIMRARQLLKQKLAAMTESRDGKS